MTASWVSSSAAAVASGTANIVPTKPTGADTGHIFAFCFVNNVNVSWTAPDVTWEGISACTNFATGISTFRHPASGSDGSTFTFTRSASVSAGGVVLVRIADSSEDAPFEGTTISAAGDPTFASYTVASDDTLILQVVMRMVSGASSWLPPVGVTERTDAAASGAANTYAVGDEVMVTSGTLGTRAWDNSTTGAVRGVSIAIPPADGVPPLSSLFNTVIVGGVKKTVSSQNVIIGGAKMTIASVNPIVGGAKKTIT